MPRKDLSQKEEQILEQLYAIDDIQGEDSDIGGDSDAEDVPVLSNLQPRTSNLRSAADLTLGTTQIISDLANISKCTGMPALRDASNINEGIVHSDPLQVAGSSRPTHELADLQSDNESDCDSDPNYEPTSPTPSDDHPIIMSSSEDEDDVEVDDNPIDDQPSNKYNWGKTGYQPKLFSKYKFSQPFGARFDIDVTSPLKIVQKFLTLALLTFIVDQSNLYSTQHGTTLDLSVDELKAFIGMLIIMGFHTLPSIRLYWSTDENFNFERITRVMTLKRFLKILRLLHINDNSAMPQRGTPNFDKLYKVRPLVDYLHKKFSKCFWPSQQLSVDESMIAFKGRHSMKQYMPMKPTKRGFKVWVIACAVSGYVCGFEIYTGKKDSEVTLSLGEKVVLFLCTPYEGLLYSIFFDNFFSSFTLIDKLLEKKLFGCGTMRANRKHYPKTFLKTDKNLKHGDMDTVQAGDISLVKWMDRGKKSVSVVSSMHNSSHKTTVLRTNKTGERDRVECPQSIADYNQFMGGVDKFDQLLSCYNISWKSRRWWMKIWYYLVDMIIVNSYIVYKTTLKEKGETKFMSQLQFRSKLANELIGSYSSRKRSGPSPGSSSGRKKNRSDGNKTVINSVRLFDVGAHMPTVGTYRRCAFCSTKAKQKRSNLMCAKCKVGLCKSCFEPFHKNNPVTTN